MNGSKRCGLGATVLISSAVAFLAMVTMGLADEPPVMQMDPMIAGACVAVRVETGVEHPVAGLMWYNNDGSTIYPEILAAAGYDGQSPDLDDALILVQDVQGLDLGWSELTFEQPVVSPTGVFYVIFRLPGFVGEPGRGAGPGLGYGPAENTSSVFVSAEGEEWIRLVTDKRPLVDPVYAGAEKSGGRAVLMLPEPGSSPEEEDARQLPVATELLAPYPNPFNPEVTISYTLKEPAKVQIAVYDLRGRRVRAWRPGVLPAGAYRETWRGEDERGRKQASGLYFIRLQAGRIEQTRRVVLLK